MNVLGLSRGQDTGGQGIGLKRAFDRYAPDWRVRHAFSSVTYLAYEGDLQWTGREDELRQLFEAADVIHLHNGVSASRRLDPYHRKPMVVHHHGSAYRRSASSYQAEDRRARAVTVVSTIDLLRYGPAEWMPQVVDEARMATIAGEHRRAPDGKLRIGHAPTARAVKSTALFLEVMARLTSRYPWVELELIERATHADCLRRKATVDLFYDQLLLGYGNNATEAWAMGIPVVAGADDWTLAAMAERFGELPFYRATEATLEARLEELILEPELRTRYAAAGLRHVERFHAQAPAVARMIELYTRAYEERHGRVQ
jgi:hypothetical protein